MRLDALRLSGMCRVTVESVDGEWVARISVEPSGQGDVVSRQSGPDVALQRASGLFMDLASRGSRKRAPRPAYEDLI